MVIKVACGLKTGVMMFALVVISQGKAMIAVKSQKLGVANAKRGFTGVEATPVSSLKSLPRQDVVADPNQVGNHKNSNQSAREVFGNDLCEVDPNRGQENPNVDACVCDHNSASMPSQALTEREKRSRKYNKNLQSGDMSDTGITRDLQKKAEESLTLTKRIKLLEFSFNRQVQQNKDLTNEVIATMIELNKYKDKINEKDRQLKTVLYLNQEALKKLEEIRGRNQQLEMLIQESSKGNPDAKNLNSVLADKEDKIKRLQLSLDEAKKKLSLAQEEQTSSSVPLEDKMKSLEIQLREKQDKIDRLHTQLKKQQDEISRLHHVSCSAQSLSDSLRQKLEEERRVLKELQYYNSERVSEARKQEEMNQLNDEVWSTIDASVRIGRECLSG